MGLAVLTFIGAPATKVTPRFASASANAARLLVAAALCWLAADIAMACNVPVFRYALERWRPDPFEIVLFHQGPLDEKTKQTLDPLYKLEEQQLVTLRLADLDQPLEEGLKELWGEQEKAEAPWMVVFYPRALRIPAPLWSGSLTADAVGGLADSPARQELAKRLMAGQTAVWLLLESGDAAADTKAATLVEEELKKLEDTLELPELSASPDDELSAPLPLEVKFSLMRVARSDPKESFLVQMLVGSESDLRERSDPMVFPVFGRSRALFGLIGPGITADNVADASSFLVGPCSCQVKELNPGFDILNVAQWDRIWGDDAVASLVAQAEAAAASEVGVRVPIPKGMPGGPAAATVASTADAPPQAAASTAASPPTNSRAVLLGGIGVAALLAVAALIAAQRSR